MKRLALLLVIMLVVPTLLTACDSESQDTAKDYIEAVLQGDLEKAQKYACDSFQDSTADLVANLPQVGENQAIRNIDLKYDLGKGNNAKEIIITGAYDIVTLNDSGRVIVDSEVEYELAAAVRDKRDINRNDNETERLDSRILIEMEKDGDDWCVALLERGYWDPQFSESEAEEEDAEDAEDAGDAEDAEDAEADAGDDGDAEDAEADDTSADESEESEDGDESADSE